MGAVQAIPVDVQPETPINWQVVDDKTQLFVPAFGRGAEQRQSFGDPYWRGRMKFRGLRQADRKRLIAALMDAQGQFNVVRVAPYEPILGSFASYCPEMMPSSTFANGMTNWESYTTDWDGAVTDQVFRGVSKGTTQNATAPPLQGTYPIYDTPVLTANAPYATRIAYRSAGGNGPAHAFGFHSTQPRLTGYSTGIMSPIPVYDPGGVATTCFNVDTAAASTGIYIGGGPKGSWIEVYYASCARCMVLDYPVNLFTYSNDLTNAAWTKSLTGVIAEGAAADPDGTGLCFRVTPTASSGGHYIYRSLTVAATEQDLVFMVAARANGYNYLVLDMNHGAAITQCFNLTSGGSVGSSSAVGGNWANKRAYTVNLGQSWVLCVLIGRKTSAGTSCQFAAVVGSVDSTFDSFTANGTSGVQLYLPTAQYGSYAGRLVSTGSSMTWGTLAGSHIPVKGLPVSQNGLLLPGAWVEAAGELKQVVSSLDSDAAGRGSLHIRPEFTGGNGLINAPVIVRNPMGRFLASIPSGIDNLYGLYSDVELDLREVYSD